VTTQTTKANDTEPAPLIQCRQAIASMAPSERLKLIRQDILDAPYHLCTQKAALTTQYFKQQAGRASLKDRFTDTLKRIHYRRYAKSLLMASEGTPQSRLQQRLGNGLIRFYRWLEHQNNGQRQLEFANALAYTLKHKTLTIYDHELIVGNPSSQRVGAPIHPDFGGLLMYPELDELDRREQNPIGITPAQRRALKEDIFPFWFDRSVLARTPLFSNNHELFTQLLDGSDMILTQFSGIAHLTPDYNTVLTQGFTGIRRSIDKHLAEHASETLSSQQRAFYRAALVVADAAIDYAKRWHDHLIRAANDETSTIRSKELLELAEIFKTVPAQPAQTFHQALQSLFVTHVIIHQESFQHGVSFGRMDQYLYPYYEADLSAGRLTPERAVELIGCFLGKASELLPLFFDRATEYFSGLSSASGITLGGNKSGQDSSNTLSLLFLKAYDQLRLRQPNLHARVHPQSSPVFLNTCINSVKSGGGMPAFFNDQTIIPALRAQGFAPQDAEDYAIVGCSEWGVPNKSFPAAGAAFINLPSALIQALSGIEKQSKLPNSIDDVIVAFKQQLQRLIATAVEGNNAIETAHARFRPTPFLSITVAGCIRKGADVNSGGAHYNSSGLQGVGLADVADSLAAIEQLVFQRGDLALEKFTAIVANNFTEAGSLRETILNKIPKYGEHAPRADHFASRISALFVEQVSAHKNPRGGNYLAGFWTMTTHQGFGRRTGALPSGRLHGETLANGISPCNGWDKQGPTAALTSAACVSQNVANGYVLNQKISVDHVEGMKGTTILEGLLKGYFLKGGMQVQFNILDPKILIDAKKHPERHRDLVVRVSGYSAYFNDLTESMKDEIIDRTLVCTC